MTLLLWLAVGVLAGILVKRLIPRLDAKNWLFGGAIAIVGAMTGGFAGDLTGFSNNLIPLQIVGALVGAAIVLFFFRQYMADNQSTTDSI